MVNDSFVYTSKERRELVRKNLITVEENVKDARTKIQRMLGMVDGLQYTKRNDKDIWELTHHLYSALQSCDYALDVIFRRENVVNYDSQRDYEMEKRDSAIPHVFDIPE